MRRLQPAAPGARPAGEAGGPVRLTRYTRGLGCACKLRPQDLEQILAALPAPVDPAVLVGTATADDAAVYRLTDDLALVQTVDFFTPVVDDPRLFGRIAVANALSDLYAMGAVPRVGLNIVGFPARRLPLSALEAILRGAAEGAQEAGLLLLGGHTIDAPEPFYGLAATGTAAPEAVWRNDTASVGDALVLTKPLGTGILATALKRGLATEAEADASADVMAALNAPAAEAVRAAAGPSACTDVTGFGLLGHLREMAAGSGVDVRLDAGAVPLLPGAHRHAAAGIVPGGTRQNLAHVAPHVDFAPEVTETERVLLADAQTSGGLLVAFPARRIEELLDALRTRGVDGAVIGEVAGEGDGRIRVTGTRSDR
ncbi:MAG: selenide, water dikinase SelD [Rhodothermales bacterium]|nr:selenide, water dikinase SelD [Rhodothermales bacterium]